MNSIELRELLRNPPAPGLEYIDDPGRYEREILNGFTMDRVDYGFDLDQFCPAKIAQLTVIVGHPNVGKTTTLMWLLSKLKRKVLIYSAENRISTLHGQYAKFFTGKELIGKEELEHVRSYIRYIKHEKHFSYKEMLEQATYLLDAGFDFDFFLIDPYNALRIDNPGRLNMHDYHYAACDEMRIFTTATNKSI